ncbi:Ribonuclease P protein component 4 [uncultured archaeon]|nr:Ribonuclease P protein component 4 [uncultured archaeon]
MARNWVKERHRKMDVADERVRILALAADKAAVAGDIDYADRYLAIARKIALRSSVPLPKQVKMRLCKGCHKYLMPGKTSRVRLNSESHRVETKCLSCGRVQCSPYLREQRVRRKKSG